MYLGGDLSLISLCRVLIIQSFMDMAEMQGEQRKVVSWKMHWIYSQNVQQPVQLYILSHCCDKESEKSTKGGKICGGPRLSPGWFALLLGAWGSENAAVVGTYGTWHRRLLTLWQPSTARAQGPWKRNTPKWHTPETRFLQLGPTDGLFVDKVSSFVIYLPSRCLYVR